jgi:hypothetical protein
MKGYVEGVLVGAFTIAGTVAFTHGGNEHVRGVVTKVSAQSVTVQTTHGDEDLDAHRQDDAQAGWKGGSAIGLARRRSCRHRRAGENHHGVADTDWGGPTDRRSQAIGIDS